MSPKGFLLLLVVGLCAAQMASASPHRQARDLDDIFNTAKDKLNGMINKAKDTARSSMETVKKYINRVEDKLLSAGNSLLQKFGVNVDLNVVSQLLKNNIQTCAKDDSLKADAKEIIDHVATCVGKDVGRLNKLIANMKGLWKTAQDLPSAVKDVSGQCKAQAEATPVPEEPLDLSQMDTTHDLADVTNEVMDSASQRLSKRDLWTMDRITRCIQSVYTFAKNDLLHIPGDILTVATEAFALAKTAEGGLPKCVSTKMAEKADVAKRLGETMKSCVANKVKDNADVKQLTNFANKGVETFNTAKAMSQLLG